MLCHYQEFGNIEAAALMGVSVEALESLLGRGPARAARGAGGRWSGEGTMSEMTRERFEVLAQAYGGELARWPDAERDAATLLAVSDAAFAQGLLAEAGDLDATLDAWRAPQADAALREAIIAAAPSPRRGLGLDLDLARRARRGTGGGLRGGPVAGGPAVARPDLGRRRGEHGHEQLRLRGFGGRVMTSRPVLIALFVSLACNLFLVGGGDGGTGGRRPVQGRRGGAARAAGASRRRSADRSPAGLSDGLARAGPRGGRRPAAGAAGAAGGLARPGPGPVRRSTDHRRSRSRPHPGDRRAGRHGAPHRGLRRDAAGRRAGPTSPRAL